MGCMSESEIAQAMQAAQADQLPRWVREAEASAHPDMGYVHHMDRPCRDPANLSGDAA